MTTPKILFLTLAFLILGSPCFAQGYMSVKIGATAQFVYVQAIDALDGYLTIRMDVTGKVPYEIKTLPNGKILIIT
ncbi:MAG: hypothetical protein V1721_05130 [Pseudomonadota bacterium]